MKLFVIVLVVTTYMSCCHKHSHHHSHNHEHSSECSHDHNQNSDHPDHHDEHQSNKEAVDLLSLSPKSPREKILDFFSSCQKEIDEWVYIPKSKPLEPLLQNCGVFANQDYLLQFYRSLATLKADFTKQHVDHIFKEFKTVRTLPEVLTCIVKQREFENQYLDEAKKFKYLAKFIAKYPQQGKDAFPTLFDYKQIGKKTCYFFKALFEFYYLEVLNPSETLSTEFFRALTVRSEVFEHEDIAFCVSIETVGKLSTELENIDINNLYVKIPEIFNTLRFLKLKEHCRDAHHRKLVKNLQTALEGLDMFKVMYQDYHPFVEIATEKMVQTQIRLLARKFADIIAEKQKYIDYSKISFEDNL